MLPTPAYWGSEFLETILKPRSSKRGFLTFSVEFLLLGLDQLLAWFRTPPDCLRCFVPILSGICILVPRATKHQIENNSRTTVFTRNPSFQTTSLKTREKHPKSKTPTTDGSFRTKHPPSIGQQNNSQLPVVRPNVCFPPQTMGYA